MWIHHGKTVVVNDEDEEEYDDETLESLSQYSPELDARMDLEFGNEQGGDACGCDGNDEGGAIMMVEHVSVMKMIWRT